MRSRYSVGVFAIVIGVLGGSGCMLIERTTGTDRSASPASSAPGTLKIFNWNVREANGRKERPGGPTAVFDHLPLDEVEILLLQEVTRPVAEVLMTRLASSFHFRWCGDSDEAKAHEREYVNDWYPAIAVARDSRFRMGRTTCRVHDPDVNGHLSARVFVDGKEVELVSLHLAPSNSLGFVSVQTEQLKALSLDGAVPTVIGGDFNAILWSSAIAKLTSAGFIDSVASARSSGAKPPTTGWPTSFPLFRPRIDRVFHDGSFRTDAAETRDRGPSDHKPLLVTLRMKDAPRESSGESCQAKHVPSHEQ